MFNSDIVLRDAHHLLCVFLAEKTIYEMTEPDQRVWGGPVPSQEVLFTLKLNFLEDEIIHGMVNLAILNRVQLDSSSGNRDQSLRLMQCGTLLNINDNSPKSEALTFREACNKIIHAREWKFTFLKGENVQAFKAGEMEPLHHEVWLYGSLSGNLWEAKLDALSFIRSTTHNFFMGNRYPRAP